MDQNAISKVIVGSILVIIIGVAALGLYVNTIHPILGSKISTSTCSFCSATGYQSNLNENAFSFSIALSTNRTTADGPTIVVGENLTNISHKTQSFEGEEADIPTYIMYYANNDTQACAWFADDYTLGNFSIAPSESLEDNSTLAEYSYSSGQTCGDIAQAPVGSYVLQVFSVWGIGSGTNITPIASANTTITIEP